MNADEVVKGIAGVQHKAEQLNNDVHGEGSSDASFLFLLLSLCCSLFLFLTGSVTCRQEPQRQIISSDLDDVQL